MVTLLLIQKYLQCFILLLLAAKPNKTDPAHMQKKALLIYFKPEDSSLSLAQTCGTPRWLWFEMQICRKTKAESDKVKGYSALFLCIYLYKGLPPMKSDHLRTPGGMPSLRGSFSLIQRAKSSAVCSERVSMG